MTRTQEYRNWIANPKREGREWDFRRNRPMTEAEVREAARKSEDWQKQTSNE